MNSNCIVCGTQYAYRKNKMYCSDSCKTKACVRRKENLPVSDESINGFPKGRNFVYDVSEYNRWSKEFKDDEPFVYWCFIRKNLPQNASLKTINFLIEQSYANETKKRILLETCPLGKEYAEFEKLFLTGHFKIIESETMPA